MGDGHEVVAAIGCRNGFYAIELATAAFTLEGVDELIDKVIDVEELHLHAAVVDLDGEVVGDVVAEGGDGGIVVRTAPFAEEIGESIDEDFGACLLGVLEHEFLTCLLALAVLGGAEASCKGGLDGTADHDRTCVVVLLEGVEEYGGETKVALHELLWILWTVDTSKVEDEGAVLTPSVELLWSGIDVIFIDGFDGLGEVVSLGLAITDVLELSTEVSTYKTFGSGNENFHICVILIFIGNSHGDLPSKHFTKRWKLPFDCYRICRPIRIRTFSTDVDYHRRA